MVNIYLDILYMSYLAINYYLILFSKEKILVYDL